MSEVFHFFGIFLLLHIQKIGLFGFPVVFLTEKEKKLELEKKRDKLKAKEKGQEERG